MLIHRTCAVPSPYPVRHFDDRNGCWYGEGRAKGLGMRETKELKSGKVEECQGGRVEERKGVKVAEW